MFLVHVQRRSRLRFCYLSWTLIVHWSRAAHLLDVVGAAVPIRPDLLVVAASSAPPRQTSSPCFLNPGRTSTTERRRRCGRSGRLSLLVADDDCCKSRLCRSRPAHAIHHSRHAHDDMPCRRSSVPGPPGRIPVQDTSPFLHPSSPGSKSRRRRSSTARFAKHDHDDFDNYSNDEYDSSEPTAGPESFQDPTTAAAAAATVRQRTLRGVERVYCLSDLHTDHPANLEWLRRRMKQPPPPPRSPSSSSAPAAASWSSKDLLVIAGDISHSLMLLETTLECLLEPGCQVLFVAGNHEAWRDHSGVDIKSTRGGETRGRDSSSVPSTKGRYAGSSRQQAASPWSSLDKIDSVYEACRRLGVVVDPCLVPSRVQGGTGSSSLHIVPLQSWYDGTLSFAPDLEAGFEAWPWVDFARCAWPPDEFPLGRDRIPQGLVEYFLESNRPALEAVLRQQPLDDPLSLLSSHPPTAVMTVSHFLPNYRTLPDWKDLDAPVFDRAWLDHGAGEMSAKFAKVAGSAKIDDQIRSLRAPNRRQLHVFGHSHRPKDFEWDGVRYVHNPLGKPRERELHMIDPHVDFQLVWDATTIWGEVPGERVLRYWDERGGGKEALWDRLEQNQGLRSRGRYNHPPKRR